jgi:hypothetical protein
VRALTRGLVRWRTLRGDSTARVRRPQGELPGFDEPHQGGAHRLGADVPRPAHAAEPVGENTVADWLRKALELAKLPGSPMTPSTAFGGSGRPNGSTCPTWTWPRRVAGDRQYHEAELPGQRMPGSWRRSWSHEGSATTRYRRGAPRMSPALYWSLWSSARAHKGRPVSSKLRIDRVDECRR